MPDTPAPPAAPPAEEPESSLSLDVITSILLRRWYWILLFALLGGAGAYYVTGKQNYIFEKTASVIMRESNKDSSSSDRIKVELGMDSGAANLANESFILRSSTVMRNTVEDLTLNVSYWKQQDLRQIDLYKDSPITVTFDDIAENRFCTFDVTLEPETP